MKRLTQGILLIIAACTVGTATCSCSNPKKMIKKTAYAYLDAMANYRVDDAEPYCTYETQITTLVTARKMVEAVDPSYIESDTPAKISIKKITVTSDTTATVTYHKKTPIKDMNGELEMLLRNGKWEANVVLYSQLEKIKHPEASDPEPDQLNKKLLNTNDSSMMEMLDKERRRRQAEKK